MAPTFWMPWGPRLTLAQRQFLAVETPDKPTKNLYRVLWRHRMEVLLLTNVPAASAMFLAAADSEKTLDMWRLALGEPPSQWYAALRGAESTQHLLRQVNWMHGGHWTEPPQQTPTQILAVLQDLTASQ